MQILAEVDLSNYSTMHLIATARELRILESEKDIEACSAILRAGTAVMLGGGSNVIFAETVERTLLRLGEPFQALEFVELPPHWSLSGEGLPGRSVVVRAGGAVPLARVVSEAAARNLCGVEKLAGIPGTVAGAVTMNAGANGGCFGDALLRARVYNAHTQSFQDMHKGELGLSYRHSILQEDPALVVTGAELLLTPVAGRDLTKEIETYVRVRSSSKIRFPNCGSVFKNPPEAVAAGRLIEAAGLKGETRGRLRVSPEHANYFENHGGATAADFRALRDHVVEKVHTSSGITLECEVKLID